MKNIYSTILMLFVFQLASAQVSNTIENPTYQYNNVLKMSPFELARSEFQISYERYFLNRRQSIFIAPSVILSSQENTEKEGFQLMVQYRFYLSHLYVDNNYTMGMHNIGFYASPYIVGLQYAETYEQGIYNPETGENAFKTINEEISAVEGGALMGVQLDVTKRIVLDFFIGGGIRKSEIDVSDHENYDDGYGLFDYGYTGVKPRIGFQIGITF